MEAPVRPRPASISRAVIGGVALVVLVASVGATFVVGPDSWLQPGILVWLSALPIWLVLRFLRRRRKPGRRRGPDFSEETRLDLSFGLPFLVWVGSLALTLVVGCVAAGEYGLLAILLGVTALLIFLLRIDRRSSRGKARDAARTRHATPHAEPRAGDVAIHRESDSRR